MDDKPPNHDNIDLKQTVDLIVKNKIRTAISMGAQKIKVLTGNKGYGKKAITGMSILF